MKQNRREFLMTAFAAGGLVAAHPSFGATVQKGKRSSADSKWSGWRKGHFQFHCIYTGVSESIFLVYPDGTSMLLDCGDHAAINRGALAVPVLPNGSRHAGEWIARYVQRVNPNKKNVDYMVLSHFHSDHSGCMAWHAGLKDGLPMSGFAQAAEWLTFRKAIDRGWPNYDDPIPYEDAERMGSRDLMLTLYRKLARRDHLQVEKVRLGATDQYPAQDAAACGDFSIRNICANGKIVLPDGRIRDLYADDIARRKPRVLNENGMSIGMEISYGKFKLFTAGDFSDTLRLADGSLHQTEDDLAEAVSRVNVAKINHHGHRSMSEKLAKALSAQVWVSCVWDQLHDTADTMDRLHRAYSQSRLYCPGIFPAERRLEDADKPWLGDIAPECFRGCHVIVDVPPGGAEYTVSFVSARDEAMKVMDSRTFKS